MRAPAGRFRPAGDPQDGRTTGGNAPSGAEPGLRRLGQQSAALLEVVLAPTTLFFTFLRLVIDPPGAAVTQFTLGFVKVSRGFGVWAALVLAIVMTVTAVQKFRAAASPP